MRFKSAKRCATLAQMQQIAAHLLFAQQVRRPAIMRGQRTNPLQIHGLGGRRQPDSPHVFDHFRTQRCHHGHSLLRVQKPRPIPGPRNNTRDRRKPRPRHSPLRRSRSVQHRLSEIRRSLALGYRCFANRVAKYPADAEKLFRSAEIFDGHCSAQSTLLTCYVREADNHVHFVDAGGGGYTMAATAPKAQRRSVGSAAPTQMRSRVES
jgi:hypothetical protein